MELFKKQKPVEDNFNRSPLRSQSQSNNTKRKSSCPDSRDSTLTRSRTFTTGLPVYNIENDPLGARVDGPLSQASSGYLSINGDSLSSATDSNVSLYKSDYGGSVSEVSGTTSELSGVSSVDSEQLNIIYASRYHALKRQSQTLDHIEGIVKIEPEVNVPIPGRHHNTSGGSSGYGSSKRRDSSRSSKSSRGNSISRHDSVHSHGSSRSDNTHRSDSVRSSTKSSRSHDSGHSSRIRSPDSVRSFRSTSSSNSAGSSSSRCSRVRYGDSGRSRHSKIKEEPTDPYFTKGVCSSFREDGSAEVKVRHSPDLGDEHKAPRRNRSNSFARRSKPCLSVLRDRDTQSLENLDKLEGETTLDRRKRKDAKSVGNLVKVSTPKPPSHYEPAGTLQRKTRAKSVGNLIGDGLDVPLESSRSTGDLLQEAPSGVESEKKTFFKRGIFKLFGKKKSEEKKEKKKEKGKIPKSKSCTLDDQSKRASIEILIDESDTRLDTLKSKTDTLKSKLSSVSREGTLTRENANFSPERGRSTLRDSKDFDRNDSLERAVQSGTLTRDNCGDRRSRDLTDAESPYGTRVGALNQILRQAKSPSNVKRRIQPPVPPQRSNKTKSTYQILNEIKAQNVARTIESMPIPDDPPTPEGPLPPSPGPTSGQWKRTAHSRDSRSLNTMAQKSDTLRRHNSRNLENLDDDTYDLPPPPEELLAMGVDGPLSVDSPRSGRSEAKRPKDLTISETKPKGILKNKTPSDDLRSPRDLKSSLNEPFYAKNQQKKLRPSHAPPVPPHRQGVMVTEALVHQESRPQLRQVQKPADYNSGNRPAVPEHRPTVPAHQNLQNEIHNVKLRKPAKPETKPKANGELEAAMQNSLQRRSRGTVLDNNINDEIKNVVLRRPQSSKPVDTKKSQNRASIRNSIVMDPSQLLMNHGQPSSNPAAVVHQSAPNKVHLISQPRPQQGAMIQTRPHDESGRNSIFDALNEHSDTLRKMATKPSVPRKPSFKDNPIYGTRNDEVPAKMNVDIIMDSYMESRKSRDSLDKLDSRKSLDSQKSFDSSDVEFPPPPPPICDYKTVVEI